MLSKDLGLDGTNMKGGRPRKIVVKLLRIKDRELNLSSAKKLKGTKIYINEDFSEAVQLRRKELWPDHHPQGWTMSLTGLMSFKVQFYLDKMISETHLDSFIDNSDVDIGGFSIYRHDRNTFGGGVTIYIRGTDNLDSRLLKLSAVHISKPTCHIFNKCLISGVCPKLWKEGKIIPLPKDTKSTFCGPNSRPISILPILSKLLEKIVFKQVQDYFSHNDLTTMFQHAYRSGHSTCTAMTQMSDSWLTSIDDSMLVGTILLDFSAAFDVIDHGNLISKLISYGFTSTAIKWFTSYLSERSQRVYFNGALSCSKSLDCEVPQGSCLRPLLFSIFTNDMPYVLSKATLTMFANDSTLYYAAPTCSELNQVLSCEVSKL